MAVGTAESWPQRSYIQSAESMGKLCLILYAMDVLGYILLWMQWICTLYVNPLLLYSEI